MLPDEAERRRHISSGIMGCFARLGYAEVSPPLLEFEESLLADGPGKALAGNTFRLMDPQTQRMLAVRSDMTAQIARIATSRLAHLPRPLRLSYSGEVLRIKAERTTPDRQLCQLGVELIGADSLSDDCEVALVALQALAEAGITDLTLDLNSPRLFDALLEGKSHKATDWTKLQAAVAGKDMDGVAAIPHPQQKTLLALLGIPLLPTEARTAALTKISKQGDLPPTAQTALRQLMQLADTLAAAMPAIRVTIDPLEQRGFDYHEGVAFAIFSPNLRGELGRGGRYRPIANGGDKADMSTGVTLYLERVLRVAPPLKKHPLTYVPSDYGFATWLDLARGGQAAIMGHHPSKDTQASADEAKQQGATTIHNPKDKP